MDQFPNNFKQANSQIESEEKSLTPPNLEKNFQNGQTISFCPKQNNYKWFALRATQRRAKSVYESLLALHDDSIELYLPVTKHITYSNSNNSEFDIIEEPLENNILFMRSSLERVLYYLYNEERPRIPGLTPYYNHCKVNAKGRNELLVIPDSQFNSFRIILESGNENIVLQANDNPIFNNNDIVEVIAGPFKGVVGKFLKYKGQKRVVINIEGLGAIATAFVPKAFVRHVISNKK